MLETNSEKGLFGLAVVLGLLLVYLLMNAPQPTAEGYCTSQCSRKTIQYDDYYGGFDSDIICGAGCDIDKITESVTVQGFTIECVCCQCVGSNSLNLPDCQPPFGFIYKYLGYCK